MSAFRFETVPASALRPGDAITETTTPQGPWSEVLAIDRDELALVVDDDTGLAVDVAVQRWSDPVLRRVPRPSR